MVLSMLPSSSLPSVKISDKILHAMFYIPMTLIPAVTFKREEDGFLIKAGLAVFVIGALLEVIQDYIPGRLFSYIDIAANCIGLCVGSILGLAWNAVTGTTNEHPPS